MLKFVSKISIMYQNYW